MSKLANKAKSSKLNEKNQQDSKKEIKEKVTRQVTHKEYPRSYRLDPEIMNTLKATLDKINETSPKKVSEARLVKALIWLSKDMDEKKILKALKEVW
jgi:hypothetical protein